MPSRIMSKNARWYLDLYAKLKGKLHRMSRRKSTWRSIPIKYFSLVKFVPPLMGLMSWAKDGWLTDATVWGFSRAEEPLWFRLASLVHGESDDFKMVAEEAYIAFLDVHYPNLNQDHLRGRCYSCRIMPPPPLHSARKPISFTSWTSLDPVS